MLARAQALLQTAANHRASRSLRPLLSRRAHHQPTQIMATAAVSWVGGSRRRRRRRRRLTSALACLSSAAGATSSSSSSARRGAAPFRSSHLGPCPGQPASADPPPLPVQEATAAARTALDEMGAKARCLRCRPPPCSIQQLLPLPRAAAEGLPAVDLPVADAAATCRSQGEFQRKESVYRSWVKQGSGDFEPEGERAGGRASACRVPGCCASRALPNAQLNRHLQTSSPSRHPTQPGATISTSRWPAPGPAAAWRRCT